MKKNNQTTYIDESGNTGGDIWHTDQPYFVIVGVTIPNEKCKLLSNFITNEYLIYKTNTEKELKAITWVKNVNKRFSLQHIVDKIGEYHSGIAAVIVEKRFMEAAIIVETFFDGAYNDNEDFSWCYDRDLRKETSDYYYNRMSDEDLSFISQTIVNGGDLDAYQKSLNLVISVTDNERYRIMLEGSKSHLQEICELDREISSFGDNLRRRVLRSPNYTGFYTICNILVKQCSINGCTSDIIFDSASMCNREFESLYNYFQTIKEDCVIPELLEIYSWKNRLTSFKIENSKQNSCLIAADILATSIFNMLTKLKDGEELYSYDAYILGLLFVWLQNGDLVPVASSNFYNQFVAALRHYSSILGDLKD